MAENQPASSAGLLYIVSTPIGNLADITLRALDVLKTVDIVAAEDTRHSRKLLSHHGVSARLISCHEHNERERAPQLVEKLAAGDSVALLSNAGTPTVSDPGYRVLQAAIAAGIRVVPIPGPSAAMTALSASGLPSDAFFFEGFLPQKGARRTARLKQLAELPATIIFYESPHRMTTLLEEIRELMGNRRVVLAREMTKRYEEFIRARVSEAAAVLKSRPAIKGELTLLVAAGQGGAEDDAESLRQAVRDAMDAGESGSAGLSRDLSKRLGVPRNKIYEIILELKQELAAGSHGKGDTPHGEA